MKRVQMRHIYTLEGELNTKSKRCFQNVTFNNIEIRSEQNTKLTHKVK